MFRNITIIGAGLIGSSVAQAIRLYYKSCLIRLADCSESVLQEAERFGLADDYHSDPLRQVKGADLVILAVPVGAMGDLARSIAPALETGCVLSDVGSVKSSVISDVAPFVPEGVHFIPAHPLAGTENSGPGAGFATLFQGRWVVITPLPSTPEDKLTQLVNLWQAFGAKTEIMDAEHHDTVLAITSHIPHLIAFSIVGTASDYEKVTESEVVKFSAAGFRDFTRIAASDPVMWRDIFLANKGAVLEMLGRTIEDLTALQRSIRWGDGKALEGLFSRTRHIRRSIIEAGQDTSAPDFGRAHGTSQPDHSGTGGKPHD